MQIGEVLAIAPLKAGRLVAGGTGLSQEISWVQVVDHPDVEPWVKEGHLLLSTGYNWPKADDEAAQIVERLSQRGISGVVLAVPHFLDHFPVASIEAAERVGLPLIEIPWEVPFSEITQAVHRELVDQQSRALIRSEEIHRELTQAAVHGSSLHDVAEVLARMLDCRAVVFSTDGGVLGAFSPRPSSPDGSLEDPIADAVLFRRLLDNKDIRAIDASSHPMRFKLGTADALMNVVGYAARVRAETVGYVVATEGSSPLGPMELRAIEHAGTVAALQISHQRELSTQEARLGYALVSSLIEGRFEKRPQTLERAKLQGWDPVGDYRLCTILLDEPNPLSREGFLKRETFVAQISASLTHRNLPSLLALSANQIHVLIPASLDIRSWWSGFHPTRMAMAVSQIKNGVEGMKDAGTETAELVDHLRPGRIHFSEEMLFPRALNGDPTARRMFVAQIFTPLQDNKRGNLLVDTALALAQEGFHLQKTADRLQVHLSTLRYRLSRIEELTGLPLETTEGRFQLQVAARLFSMAADT